MEEVIRVDGISKYYQLGAVSSGSMKDDIRHLFHKLTGKEKQFYDSNVQDEQGTYALSNVSFSVNRGEVIGLIGKNGAGKSTLLKIISRITEPSAGTIKIKGRVSSLLEVGTGFHPELTGKENIYLNGAILGMKKPEIDKKLEQIVEFAGVGKYLYTPVKRYSSGMYVRLAFGIAAHLEPEILIVDEVLAVGDAEFQKRCLGKMKEVSGEGRTVLFVSHNLSAVRDLCTRGVLLENGKLTFDGPVSGAIEKYFAHGGDMSKTGVVPAGYERLYGTGEIRIHSAYVTDPAGKVMQNVFFRSPLTIRLDYECFEEVTDALFTIRIARTDGNFAGSSDYLSSTGECLSINKGKGFVTAELDETFLPGEYCIFVSAARSNGTAIDHIERIFDFTVLKNAIGKGRHYRWTTPTGFVEFKTKWQIKP